MLEGNNPSWKRSPYRYAICTPPLSRCIVSYRFGGGQSFFILYAKNLSLTQLRHSLQRERVLLGEIIVPLPLAPGLHSLRHFGGVDGEGKGDREFGRFQASEDFRWAS